MLTKPVCCWHWTNLKDHIQETQKAIRIPSISKRKQQVTRSRHRTLHWYHPTATAVARQFCSLGSSRVWGSGRVRGSGYFYTHHDQTICGVCHSCIVITVYLDRCDDWALGTTFCAAFEWLSMAVLCIVLRGLCPAHPATPSALSWLHYCQHPRVSQSFISVVTYC